MRLSAYLPLTAIVILAAMLRLCSLGREDLWSDEVYQLRVSEQSLSDIVGHYRPGLDLAAATRDQAPLSNIVSHFFVSEHDTEWWIRLPSTVFSTLGVVLLFVAARRLTGPRTALAAAFLLAINPLDVWYAQEARWYAQWSALCTLSWIFLFVALDRPVRWPWLAYAATVAAGVYTFILTPLVIAAQFLYVLHCDRRHRHHEGFRSMSYALAGAVLLCLPVATVVLSELGHGSGTPRPLLLSVLPYTFYAYSVGLSYGPSVFELHALPSPLTILATWPSIAFIALVWGGIFLLGIRNLYARGTVLAPLLWVVSAPALLFVVAAVSDVAYNVRYTIPALPAFAIIVAAGIQAIDTRWQRIAVAAAVLVFSAMSLQNHYGDPRYDRPHVREALAALTSDDQRQSQVLALGQIDLPVQYYGGRKGFTVETRCSAYTSASATAVDRLPPDPLWVLVGQDYGHSAPKCLSELLVRYRITRRRNVPGVELWRLEPKRT